MATQDAVPVWDPDSQSLKSLPSDQAAQLAREGYAIGPEAQGTAIRHSLPYHLAGFAAIAGNAGSMGLSNLTATLLGQGKGVREEEKYQEDNPIEGGAATLAGYAASAAVGPLSVGVGGAARAAGALAGPVARVATEMATQGAPAALVKGALDGVTRAKVMDDPVHLDQIAASALSEAAWNAGANVVGKTIGELPTFLKSVAPNFVNAIERAGLIKAAEKRVAAVETEPHMRSVTLSGEDAAEHTASQEAGVRVSAEQAASTHLHEENAQSFKVERNVNSSEERATKTVMTERTAKAGETPPREQAPKEASAPPEPPKDLSAADVEPSFHWPEEYTTKQKRSKLTQMIKFILKDDPKAMAKYDRISAAERENMDLESQKLNGNSKKAKRENARIESKQRKLWEEKRRLKNELTQAYPQRVDGDRYIPGFADYNDEYARVGGNPYKDLRAPEFDVRAEIPKANGAQPKARINQTFTQKEEEALKYKLGEQERDMKQGSAKSRSDEKAHAEKTFEASARGKESATARTKRGWRVTIAFPKAPAQTVRTGAYTSPLGRSLTQGALVPAVIPVLRPIGGAMAAAGGALQGIAALASHGEALGNYWGKYVIRPLAKWIAPGVKPAAMTLRAQRDAAMQRSVVDVRRYEDASNAVNGVAAAPAAVQTYLEQTYPSFHAKHPNAAAQVAATITRAVSLLNETGPKRPYEPTLRDSDFRPTRSQQHRFLSRWQILANPYQAIETGDPQTLQILKEAYPAWYNYASKHLMNEARNQKGPILGRMARNITSFTGAPVNPLNNSAALKRMQATAGPSAQGGSQGPGGPAQKMRAGAPSAKITNQASERDAPSDDPYQLGE